MFYKGLPFLQRHFSSGIVMVKVHLHSKKLYFKIEILSIFKCYFFGMIHILVTSNDAIEVFISR